MIAGCLSQAKNILEGYDEILHGPSPEELVERTHEAISKLLGTQEALSLFSGASDEEEDIQRKRDVFIKRVVEAVSPIIPVTIRNKSLDSTFFRTALHLLGAAELLFSQYETDIRSQANPAGLVGMCNAMHADIKRSAVHSTGLKSLGEFMKEMRSQYNTYLGLGESFHNDITRRERRRGRVSRYPRNQSWRTSERIINQNSGRAQRSNQSLIPTRASTDFGQINRAQLNPIPLRAGRNDCYAFLAGNCRRGNECRFVHRNP